MQRAVTVILVHRYHEPVAIHHRYAVMQGSPNHPVVPVTMADDQRGHVRIHSLLKNEKIDPAFVLPKPFRQGDLSDFPRPLRVFKTDRLGDVHVPPPRHQQKLLPPRPRIFKRPQKVLRQNNVAVREAQIVVTRDLLRAPENRVQIFRAALMPRHFRLVPQAQFRAYLCGSGIVSEQNYLDFGVESLPTRKRISLNNAVVPKKRFRGSEESQHSIEQGISEIEPTRRAPSATQNIPTRMHKRVGRPRCSAAQTTTLRRRHMPATGSRRSSPKIPAAPSQIPQTASANARGHTLGTTAAARYPSHMAPSSTTRPTA